MTKPLRPLGALSTLFAAGLCGPALACSSCGCNLASDWLTEGLVTQPGTTLSMRYDFVPQTQLRAGTGPVDVSAISLPADREIERSTYNHYATFSLDHVMDARWAFNVQVPLVYRPHATIAEDTTDLSRSRTGGLGDVKVAVRYQGSSALGVTGMQLGLKLPTGAFHQTFRSGPAEGEEVDRGLQPGTGTVNALLGAYHYGLLPAAWAYVLQAQGELPLNSRDSYRPGAAVTVSAGVHYTGWPRVSPQLQLNFRAAARDRGANSDRANSGGEQLYLAPGFSAALGPRASAFGFVQIPLYERVGGYQLAPKTTVSVGLQYRL